MIALKNILPVSMLRNKLNDIEEICHHKEPVLLTKNGKSKLVVMDATEFELMQKEVDTLKNEIKTLKNEIVEYEFAHQITQGLLKAEVGSRRGGKTYSLDDLMMNAGEIINGSQVSTEQRRGTL